VNLRVEGRCEELLQPAIQVTRDDWKSVERTWSRKDSPLGWRQESGDAEIAIAFRPPEALDEDTWQWRARVQAGGVPTESARGAAFRVDVTPPAEIENLTLQRRADGSVLLRWDPVTQDVEGRPETIDHYVVYRYERRGTFPQGPLVKVGESRAPSYVDRRGVAAKAGAAKERADEAPLLQPEPPPRAATGRSATGGSSTIYYKIVGVDLAGNELGMREGTKEPAAPAPKPTPRPASPPRARPMTGGDGG